MAAWRFYNNPRIELAELVEPLRDHTRRQLAETMPCVVLLVHDWCKLSYPGHASKHDQAELTQGNNRGYEVTSVLAVSGTNGAPLAPVEMHLKTAHGVLSTRDPTPPDVHHLEQILPSMEASRTWNLGCRALHVIDREADSVGHFRAWHAAGHHFLVRGHDHRVVTWEKRTLSRQKVVGSGAVEKVVSGLPSAVNRCMDAAVIPPAAGTKSSTRPSGSVATTGRVVAANAATPFVP